MYLYKEFSISSERTPFQSRRFSIDKDENGAVVFNPILEETKPMILSLGTLPGEEIHVTAPVDAATHELLMMALLKK